MNFNDIDLSIIRNALMLSIDYDHNEIVTCPDVDHFASALVLIEDHKEQLEKIVARIDKKFNPK
jgi:hypothetical protein